MPTVFTHAVVAGVAAKVFAGQTKPLRFWIAAVVVSVLPDADVLGFAFGVRYGDFLGHRGCFHSLFFALILSVFCLTVLFRHHRAFTRKWWNLLTFFFIVGASHGLLDALTNGGLGIALLAPFDNTRYFFPWRPVPVAPISLRAFMSTWGMRIIVWECTFIWLPMLLSLASVTIMRYVFHRNTKTLSCM